MSWINSLLDEKPAVRDVVAWRGELEFLGASEDDRTGRTVKLRIVRPPEELIKANPFAQFTRRRGNRAGTRFTASIIRIDNTAPVYAGEAMLLNWASGPSGDSVQLLLDHETDTHPFLGGTRPSKAQAGTRYMAVFAELQDDNTHVNQAKAERLEAAQRGEKVQHLSVAAAGICRNPRFWDFLRETVEAVDWNEKSAADWVRSSLQIKSRSELDVAENKAAIRGFDRIRKKFVEWQEENGGIEFRS